MKTVKGLLGAAVIATSIAGLPANALEMGATDKAIKLAINEWTGQHLSTRVAGAILERAGYSVEYVTAGYGPQFIALGEGDLHATLEIWTSNAPGQFGEAEAAGKVVDIGDLGLDAREGVLYPVHMKEVCPGLPDWEALNACADKFASVETLPKGRLLDYPADWGSPGKDRFEAMGMNFTAVHRARGVDREEVASGDDLLAAALGACRIRDRVGCPAGRHRGVLQRPVLGREQFGNRRLRFQPDAYLQGRMVRVQRHLAGRRRHSGELHA